MLPLNAVEIFETFQAVAKRVCADEDIANDLATQEFERYIGMAAPSVVTNLRAYAWKILGAKWRQHLKNQWAFVTEGRFDEDGRQHDIYPPSRATQEQFVEARQWLPLIDELPEPCRSAISILCGGGSISDVITELEMSPKSALYAVAEARRILRNRIEGIAEEVKIAA